MINSRVKALRLTDRALVVNMLNFKATIGVIFINNYRNTKLDIFMR